MLKKYFTEEEINIIKNEDDLIKKSLYVINILFNNIKDKEGEPYINHLLYVGNNLNNSRLKVLGYMHDTLEDINIEKEDLIELGFPIDIVLDLDLLTRKSNMTYDEYIDNILNSNNYDVINVKYVDMSHNYNMNRISKLDIKLQNKFINKYKEPYKKLCEKLGKEI